MNTAGKIGLLALASFGVFLIAFGVYFLFEAKQSTQWDQVKGTVADRYVHRRRSLNSRTSSIGDHFFEYHTTIKYNYVYEGKNYEGTRFSLGSGDTVEDGFKEKEEAQLWLKDSNYQIDSAITVFVKPGFPQQTVISSGINVSTYMPIIIGLLFIGTAYLVFFFINKATLAKNSQILKN